MESRVGVIYKAVSPSGKIYIGQTITKLEHRISRHKHSAMKRKSGTKFARAIRKYENKIEFSVIYENVPVKLLGIAEICAAYLYDSYYKGYNSTLGGDFSPSLYPEINKKRALSQTGEKNHMFGKCVSQSTRDKISKALAGRKHSQKTKDKISKSNKGKRKGMKASKEARAKMSKSRIGIPCPTKGKKLGPRSASTIKKMKAAWTTERRRERSKKYKGKGNSFYGKTHSEEAKKKISNASIGRNLGKKHTVCSKRKIALSHAKVTREQVGKIIEMYKAGGISQKEIGKRFGISQSRVSGIILGKNTKFLMDEGQ